MGANHHLRRPDVVDGARIWRLAGAAGGLDRNTPYAYVLWCRDFAGSSVVAESEGGADLEGFITGYRRPDEPTTLFVWQVAVAPEARGAGLGGRMLDHLAAGADGGPAPRFVEATVTPDNVASQRMFASFADRAGVQLERSALFAAEHFPSGEGGHEPEDLLRIGPFG